MVIVDYDDDDYDVNGGGDDCTWRHKRLIIEEWFAVSPRTLCLSWDDGYDDDDGNDDEDYNDEDDDDEDDDGNTIMC